MHFLGEAYWFFINTVFGLLFPRCTVFWLYFSRCTLIGLVSTVLDETNLGFFFLGVPYLVSTFYMYRFGLDFSMCTEFGLYFLAVPYMGFIF